MYELSCRIFTNQTGEIAICGFSSQLQTYRLFHRFIPYDLVLKILEKTPFQNQAYQYCLNTVHGISVQFLKSGNEKFVDSFPSLWKEVKEFLGPIRVLYAKVFKYNFFFVNLQREKKPK